MALANSNRYKLRYKPESSIGVPVAASACYALRNTGESLNYDVTTIASNEIRDDRNVTDLTVVDAESNGGIPFEFSYAEYDWFLSAVLQNAWTVFGTNGVSDAIPTSATFAASTLTAGAATSGTSIFTNLVKGQWVKIAGSSNAGQNIWAQVSLTTAPTSTVLTFEGTPFTSLTGNGGASVTVSASRLKNGTTPKFGTLEKEFADVSRTITYKGMMPNRFSLRMAPAAMITGDWDFLGLNASSQAGSLLNATVTAATAYSVMNAVNNMANILEGGAALSGTYMRNLTMDINNSLRGKDALANLGNVDIGSGTFTVTGTLEAYFADATLYEKFINNTSSSLSFRLNDASGNGYVVTLPNVKYTQGAVNAGGSNQDVMANMSYQALYDSTSGATIIIDRAGAAVTAVA